VVVHDCGRELQIRSSSKAWCTARRCTASSAALLEEFRYDEQGQLLTATFLDYPEAQRPTDVPEIEVDRLEQSLTLHGARGQGRGRGRRHPGTRRGGQCRRGRRLSAFGVTVRELPITPPSCVWRWIVGGPDVLKQQPGG
jgi:hypothetical protein